MAGTLARLIGFVLRHVGFRDLWDLLSWGASFGLGALVIGLWDSLPTDSRIILFLAVVLMSTPFIGAAISKLRQTARVVLPDQLHIDTSYHSVDIMPGFHLTVPLEFVRNASDKPVAIEIKLRIYNEKNGRKQDLRIDQSSKSLPRVIEIEANKTITMARLIYWLTAIEIAWVGFVPLKEVKERPFRYQLVIWDIERKREIGVQNVRSITVI